MRKYKLNNSNTVYVNYSYYSTVSKICRKMEKKKAKEKEEFEEFCKKYFPKHPDAKYPSK